MGGLRRSLVSALGAGVATLALAGAVVAAPAGPVRISDLVPASGATVQAGQEVELSGFIETDNSIGIVGDKPDVTVKVDGAPIQAEFMVGSKALNVGFRATQSFKAGPHTLSVTARDFSGNSATAESKFTAVAAAPIEISDLVPPSGAAVGIGQSVVVSGSVESEREIAYVNGLPDLTVKIDGATVEVQPVVGTNKGFVAFLATRTFAAGSHTLSVTSRDVSGQSATAETKFTATKDAPTIKVSDLAPASGASVAAGQEVELSGFVEAEAGIRVNATNMPFVDVEVDDDLGVPAEFVAGSKGTTVAFRATRTFTPGTHAMRVTARDVFGQSATAETKFTVAGPGVGDCHFVLGFADLKRQLGDVAGRCLADEFVDPLTGDTLQPTSGPDGKGGMMVWRKADNFLAFTDGYRTWVRGANGAVEKPRLNTERYPWEKERLSPKALSEAEYRLPIGPNGAEVLFALPGGRPTMVDGYSVSLPDRWVWYGDFDGDSCRDAVVLLAVSGGGSGTFVYAVPVLDLSGQPKQLGYQLLGDRVQVKGVGLGKGEFRVDMLTQGPNDPMATPTQRVLKSFAVKAS